MLTNPSCSKSAIAIMSLICATCLVVGFLIFFRWKVARRAVSFVVILFFILVFSSTRLATLVLSLQWNFPSQYEGSFFLEAPLLLISAFVILLIAIT